MKKKAKRFTGWLLALAMFLTLLPQAVIAEDPGDTGDLTITTLEELEEFRDAVNGGDDFEGKTVVLANDIDMSEKYGADIDGSEVSWTPIGSDSNQFLGTFDGGGYEVRGLYINTDTDNQGLFGYLGEGGIIRNLTVYGMAIGRYQVAGILGYNSSGSVIDCVNNCTITGATTVGGIVGINIGNNATVSTVQGCSNYGMITCTNVSDGGVGGIAGSNSSANAMIEGCTNYGTVQGAADSTYGYIGGITGTNYAVVRNCANEANARISGGAYYSIGGIVGYNYSEITNSYNLGVVESGENAAYRGGIAGLSYQKGYPGDMSNPPRIENCYSNTGSITAGAQEDSVFNSYYLSDTETEEANGMTGKTTAQFASGEVAWLLQNGQTTDSDGVKPQVWGQTLSGETPDAYPVFTSDSARSLVKVSFMTGDTEYAAAYANPGGTVTLPQAPTMMNNEFAYWTIVANSVTDGKDRRVYRKHDCQSGYDSICGIRKAVHRYRRQDYCLCRRGRKC